MTEPGFIPKQLGSRIQVLNHDASECCHAELWRKELQRCKSYFRWLIFFKSITYFKALYILTDKNYHESQLDMGGRMVSFVTFIEWFTLRPSSGQNTAHTSFCFSLCSSNNPSVLLWILKRMIPKGPLHFCKPYNHWGKVLARRRFNMTIALMWP